MSTPPPVPTASGRGVADITVLWKGSLLDVVRVGAGESFALPSGSGQAAGQTFVHVDEDGLRLTPPPGLVIVEPQVPPSVRALSLPARSCARAVSGDLAFIVRHDDRHLVAERQRRIDKRLLTISSFAMIVQVSLLIAVSLAPSPERKDDPGLLRTRAAFAVLHKRVTPTPPARWRKRAPEQVEVAQAARAPRAGERRAGGSIRAEDAVRALFGGAGADHSGGGGLFASVDGALSRLSAGAGDGGGGPSGGRDIGAGTGVIGIGDRLGDGDGTDDGGDGIDLMGGHRDVRVRAGPNVVTRGGLEREEIARVVRRHLAQFRHCYEKELTRDPNLKGRVGMSWTITGTGAIVNAAADDTEHAGLSRCLVRVVERMRFPRPRGGGQVFVRWPFVFATSS